ncbi:MAG: TraM recognition domain-containing protein [Xanthomonadaceae bacterium]|nr:TraM recognition domain-containing protein [Xanthomonadaceae bacterium]
MAERDFMELSGLRDQIKTLCMGHLSKTLSPKEGSQIDLQAAESGKILYFRLQSLMSPQLVTTLGRLLINHLSFLAGTAHRSEQVSKEKRFIPVYLNEFASFACPEFADLISKARSAGLALHFSHQSIGDLAEVSEGFLNRITDNAGTKIVLRINDPDSAEFFARSFGTKLYQKTTQRITNAKEIDLAETLSEGTQREAHQFRASPDLFKTLPTGMGAVLIAHGEETPHGASSVFKIRFPRLGA